MVGKSISLMAKHKKKILNWCVWNLYKQIIVTKIKEIKLKVFKRLSYNQFQKLESKQ